MLDPAEFNDREDADATNLPMVRVLALACQGAGKTPMTRYMNSEDDAGDACDGRAKKLSGSNVAASAGERPASVIDQIATEVRMHFHEPS